MVGSRHPIDWMFSTMDRALVGTDDVDRSVAGSTPVEQLAARLAEAGRYVTGKDVPEAPTDRADSLRYLLTLLHVAVERGVANQDPYRPLLSRPWPCHVLDWGGGSPDAVYRHAVIRGDASYRLSGRLGNAKSISFQVFDGNDPVDTITRADLDEDVDGNFEIVLGGPDFSATSRPLAPFANFILTREFFDDWSEAHRSLLRIECLDARAHVWPVSTNDRVGAEFDAVGQWLLKGGLEFWADRENRNLAQRSNAFNGEFGRVGSGLPALCHGSWDLAPDAALLVEIDDPRAPLWALQLCSFWWRTLDYANCLTTYNNSQAHRDPDGVIRLVLSASDPGVHNWLDTTGLQNGVLLYRVVDGQSLSPPRCRVIDVVEVPTLLPGTRFVDAAERRAQVAARREGVSRLLVD